MIRRILTQYSSSLKKGAHFLFLLGNVFRVVFKGLGHHCCLVGMKFTNGMICTTAFLL